MGILVGLVFYLIFDSVLQMDYLYWVLVGVAVALLINAILMFISSKQWTYERARNELENEMIGKYNDNMMKPKIIY